MCDLDLWSRFAASTEAGSIPVRPASDRRSENPIAIDFFVTEWRFVERCSKKLVVGFEILEVRSRK